MSEILDSWLALDIGGAEHQGGAYGGTGADLAVRGLETAG